MDDAIEAREGMDIPRIFQQRRGVVSAVETDVRRKRLYAEMRLFPRRRRSAETGKWQSCGKRDGDYAVCLPGKFTSV